MDTHDNLTAAATNANREHKSSVFAMLFSEPEKLRELYSAIEGIELPPDVPITISTLTDILIKGQLNDISFTIDNRLVVLIEHQSTICENMPLRLLIYLAEIYKNTVDRKKMVKKKLLKIPKPEFIVLYNGVEPYDDFKELRLSDAFIENGLLQKELLPMELTVKVYNINKGRNSDMVKKSENLEGYSIFIDKIREYQGNNFNLAEALKLAVYYCLENGILAEFLEKYKGELMNSLIQDLTIEEWQEVAREEGFEEGLEKGLEQGREEGLEEGLEQGRAERDKYLLALLAQGLSIEEIKHRLENDE